MMRSIRFKPDQGDFALIDTDPNREEFTPIFAGLIVNESLKGCALVMKKDDNLKLDAQYRVQVGRNAPYLAEVRWAEEIDEGILKVGFHLLE